MNKQQMEMLSVKSAIERTANGLIASFSTIPNPNADLLYDEISRYMASLFASRQIDQDYRVARQAAGNILRTETTHKPILHGC